MKRVIVFFLLHLAMSLQGSILDDLKNVKATLTEKTRQLDQAIKGADRTMSNLEKLSNSTLTTTIDAKEKALELKQMEESYQRARMLADIFEMYVPVLQNAQQTVEQVSEDFIKPFASQNRYEMAKKISTEFKNAIAFYREQVKTLRQVADAMEKQVKACE